LNPIPHFVGVQGFTPLSGAVYSNKIEINFPPDALFSQGGFFGRSLLRKKHLRSPYSAEKKQGDRILFGYGGDRLCPKTRSISNLDWRLQKTSKACINHLIMR
jgi:hypothetical protein